MGGALILKSWPTGDALGRRVDCARHQQATHAGMHGISCCKIRFHQCRSPRTLHIHVETQKGEVTCPSWPGRVS